MSSPPQSSFSAGPDELGPRPQTNPWRWLWTLAAFALLIAVTLLSRRGTEPTTGIGERLTALELSPLVNVEQPLRLDDLAGRVALINYWGTWCPPCRIELPHLVELHRRFADQPDFRFVSISCAGGPPPEPVEALRDETARFLTEQNYTFPVYTDPQFASRRALADAAKLEGFAFPTTVLLDRQGVIRGLWVGYADGLPAEIEAELRRLLAPTAAP